MHFSLQPPSHFTKNLELLLHLALQSIAQLNSTQPNLTMINSRFTAYLFIVQLLTVRETGN